MAVAASVSETGDAGPRRAAVGVWTGRIMSGVVVAFLLMDAGLKLANLPIVASTGLSLGWQPDTALPLGVIVLGCAVLYAWPRTAVLGAVLLTGLLGGAVATHMRVGSPLFSHTLFGVYLGLIAWGGLYLRDPRVRAILPARR
jgi:hypothetical protein